MVSGASTSTSLGMSVGQARARLKTRPRLNLGQAKRLRNNQYAFQVHSEATRSEIESLIKKTFDVKVVGVSTFNPLRNNSPVGQFRSFVPGYKQAVVTLAPGDTISLTQDIEELSKNELLPKKPAT